MPSANSPSDEQVAAYVRLLLIVEAAGEGATQTCDVRSIHSICYFADALAPIWGVRTIHPQILKRSGLRANPEVQNDLDDLVAFGLLHIIDPRYRLDPGGYASLDAGYSTNQALAAPVLSVVRSRAQGRLEARFVSELCLALSGLETESLWRSPGVDATYGDGNIDFGTIVDVKPSGNRVSRTVKSALVFQGVAEDERLDSAELINLYVRHLYYVLRASDSGVANA